MSRVLPILFNTEMVRAILDGRKTVTRRLIKIPPNDMKKEQCCAGDGCFVENGKLYSEIQTKVDDSEIKEIKPPYQPGDILYIRETFCPNYFNESIVGCFEGVLKGNRNAYKADYHKDRIGDVVPEPKWKPSIYMPKEAARIWLKVKNVRVERLQDMDCEDAMKEGIDPRLCVNLAHTVVKFKKLWNSTLKKSDLDRYGWDANPWVWVIEFERCDKPGNEG